MCHTSLTVHLFAQHSIQDPFQKLRERMQSRLEKLLVQESPLLRLTIRTCMLLRCTETRSGGTYLLNLVGRYTAKMVYAGCLPAQHVGGYLIKQRKGLQEHLLSGACLEPEVLRKPDSNDLSADALLSDSATHQPKKRIEGPGSSRNLDSLAEARIPEHRCEISGCWAPDHSKLSRTSDRHILKIGRAMDWPL